MAKKKTRSLAEKVASSKNKGKKSGASTKKTAETEKPAGKSVKSLLERWDIPFRFFSAGLFFVIFALLLVTFLAPGGIFFIGLEGLIHGLFGQVGFLVSIPVTLYIFIIHAFSGKRPVRMRTACLLCFILICGCIGHLFAGPVTQDYTFASIGKLYVDGVSGSSGGVICGLLTQIIAFCCGKATIVFVVIGALFSLLAGMQITIPSIVRAVRNRPRADWEDTEEEKPEPAAIVVNHLANKRIEHINNRRLAAEQAAEEEKAQSVEVPAPKKEPKHRASDIMRQIENDVESPVAVAGVYGEETKIDPVSRMPLLDLGNDLEEEAPPVKEKPVRETPVKVKVTAKEAASSAIEVAAEIAQAEVETKPVYSFPPIDLLKKAGSNGGDGLDEMRENTRRLNETLASFKIEAHIINVTR